MEPVTSTAAVIAAEKVAETTAIQEWASHAFELSRKMTDGIGVSEIQFNEKTVDTLNQLLDQDRYKKLAEFRETSIQNPEAARALFNNVQIKGQMGESVMEAQLSPYGEVKTQVPVQLEAATTSNKVDLVLTESNANLKQVEINLADNHLFLDNNYDIIKGDSASFEVKNGGLPYLRQELLSGELQQQIAAGKSIADQSYVVISEDTAKSLMANPTMGTEIVQSIQDAGGRLIVGLPEQAVQQAIFLS
ncbi:hypothetical protein [Paenibacillus sp. WC2504]|uniref:hypothetical protein n=1 Tax=Paenibacillus sp. WC2504 TaxID=3461403 RepID=UPI004046091C